MDMTADPTLDPIEEAERIAPRENDVLYEDRWIEEMIREVALGKVGADEGVRLVRINKEPHTLRSPLEVMEDRPQERGRTYGLEEPLGVNEGSACASCLNSWTWAFYATKPDAILPDTPAPAEHRVLIAAGALVVAFHFCQRCMDRYLAAYPGIVTEHRER